MKIGHFVDKHALPATPAQPTAAESAKTSGAAAPAAATAAPADASAKVELSSTASTLLSSGASAEFDAKKVDHVAASIAAGTFKINPEAIADKLISNAREVLGQVQAG